MRTLYLVNTDHLEDAVMDTESCRQLSRLIAATRPNNGYTAVLLRCPTEDQLQSVLYWNEDEQAFLPE